MASTIPSHRKVTAAAAASAPLTTGHPGRRAPVPASCAGSGRGDPRQAPVRRGERVQALDGDLRLPGFQRSLHEAEVQGADAARGIEPPAIAAAKHIRSIASHI